MCFGYFAKVKTKVPGQDRSNSKSEMHPDALEWELKLDRKYMWYFVRNHEMTLLDEHEKQKREKDNDNNTELLKNNEDHDS